MKLCRLVARRRLFFAAVTLATAGWAQSQSSLLDGLQARWDFDESSGLTAADSSGSGNNGSLNNFNGDDSQWIDGKWGGAIAFDGSNYVEVPDNASIGADILDEFTVAAWFRSNVELDAGGGPNRMLEKGNSYFFLQGIANGGMNFLVKKEGNQTAGIQESIPAGEWHHITGVFDGSEIRVYLDGDLKDTVAVDAPVEDGGLPLRIGSDDGGSFFNGDMDQVAIWNRELDDDEIIDLVDDGLPAPEQNAPEVVESPQSVETFEGSTVTFSAQFSGTQPLTFLWLKDGEPLRAETQSELTLFGVTPEDAGAYSLRIQNNLGEATTDAATLSVIPVEGLETGRVGYWAFDETSGESASDASGNGADGELNNFPGDDETWVEGIVGGALAFDGDGTYVVVDDNDALDSMSQEGTISFWVRPNSYGQVEDAGTFTRSASYVIRKGDHFHARLVDDPGSVRRTLLARAGAGADSGAAPRQGFEVNSTQGSLVLDEWQHFSIVYRAGTIQFFKNGFPLADPVAGELGQPGDAPLVIGEYDDSGFVRPLDGALDELSIWARPLSEAELLEIAGQDVSGAPVIAEAPKSVESLEGTTVEFRTVATGLRPVSYQWSKDGAPIEGATGSRLILNRIGPDAAGEYSVTVTNDVGSVTSDPAVLQVELLGAITSGLAAYFPFDGLTDDTLVDDSGNENHGELMNFDDDALTSGVVGGALRFDGADDFAVVPHSDKLTLGREATISVWLNIDSVGNNGDFDRVFRKDVNFDLVLLNNGVVRLHGINKDPYSTPGGTWVEGVWEHYAYVVKGGTIQWYKNGEPIGGEISGQLGAETTAPLVIGNFQPDLDLTRMYEGALDDMGIWRRALSSADVFAIYQNGLRGEPLTEEFEPLNIRSISVDASNVSLTYFTPFPTREHVVQTRSSVIEAWEDLPDAPVQDLGEGQFLVELPDPTGNVAFYRVISFPPPPIFVEDFESGAEGWTHGGDEDEWELGAPEVGPDAAFSGENVYGTDLDDDFDGLNDAWLRSPAIDLSGVSIATLEFAEWHSVDPVIDFHFVAVNILDADTDEIIEEVFRAAGTTDDWTPQSIRLLGQTADREIKVEFRLVTDDFGPLEGFYIDDVVVREN